MAARGQESTFSRSTGNNIALRMSRRLLSAQFMGDITDGDQTRVQPVNGRFVWLALISGWTPNGFGPCRQIG